MHPAIDAAFERLKGVGGQVDRLSDADRTIVIVTSAQGVIDDGGFEYFFGSDFPGTPPYSWFSAAYRRIGALVAAARIDEASILFPFAEPHLHEDERRRYIQSLPERHRFRELGAAACGDAFVWARLEAFARAQAPSGQDGPVV